MNHVSQQLLHYVEGRRSKGKSNTEIIDEMTEHGWKHDEAVRAVNSISTHKQSFQNRLPMDIGVMIALLALIFIMIVGAVYLSRGYNSVKDSLTNTFETIEIQ